MPDLTSDQLARIQAFKDAISIVESRRDAMTRFGARMGVPEALEEAIIFLKAELGRCEAGTSTPGRPGAKAHFTGT